MYVCKSHRSKSENIAFQLSVLFHPYTSFHLSASKEGYLRAQILTEPDF